MFSYAPARSILLLVDPTVIAAWLVAIAVTSLLMLALVGLRLVDADSPSARAATVGLASITVGAALLVRLYLGGNARRVFGLPAA